MCIVFVIGFQKMNLAGLWFDDEKPTMSTFLCSLTLEMSSLYEKGSDTVFSITTYLYTLML